MRRQSLGQDLDVVQGSTLEKPAVGEPSSNTLEEASEEHLTEQQTESPEDQVSGKQTDSSIHQEPLGSQIESSILEPAEGTLPAEPVSETEDATEDVAESGHIQSVVTQEHASNSEDLEQINQDKQDGIEPSDHVVPATQEEIPADVISGIDDSEVAQPPNTSSKEQTEEEIIEISQEPVSDVVNIDKDQLVIEPPTLSTQTRLTALKPPGSSG